MTPSLDEPLADPRPHLLRPVHGRPRRDGRERRAARRSRRTWASREANLQWIVNAYTLVFGGFLLLGGRAGDLLGRKRLFLFGLVVFTTRVAARRARVELRDADRLARAPGPRRGVHLAGGARDHHDDVRRRAPSGRRRSASGPRSRSAAARSASIVGGALTQLFSWPWIFFINVPVGIAVFFASLRYVPESKDEAAHRSFDVAGAVTVTGGLMTLVYAIVQAQEKGWTSAQTIGTFALVGGAARQPSSSSSCGRRRRSCGCPSSAPAR